MLSIWRIIVLTCYLGHTIASPSEKRFGLDYIIPSEVEKINQFIFMYSAGQINSTNLFVEWLTDGLFDLFPSDFKKKIRIEVDNHPVFAGKILVQGIRLDLENMLSLVVGCQIRGPGLVEIPNKNLDFERLKGNCIPTVYVKKVSLPPELRSKGLTTRLLVNVMNVLESIHDGKEKVRMHETLPRILLIAKTLNFIDSQNQNENSFGAAYWARCGFDFASNEARNVVIYEFIRWATENSDSQCLDFNRGAFRKLMRTILSTKSTEQYLEKLIKTPADLLELDLQRNCGSSGKNIGRRFLTTAPLILWNGKLVLDTSSKHYQKVKSFLLSRIK